MKLAATEGKGVEPGPARVGPTPKGGRQPQTARDGNFHQPWARREHSDRREPPHCIYLQTYQAHVCGVLHTGSKLKAQPESELHLHGPDHDLKQTAAVN